MANDAEEPPMSIVFLEHQSYSHVTFPNVKKSYAPGVDITCQYSLSMHITHRPKDWLGIFKVGWTTPRDYYTFVWAPPSTSGDGAQEKALFKAYYLPKDEEEYYQFCYVDEDGAVRGASGPFRFHRETEDDMVLVPTPGELESLQEKNKQIQKENEELKEKYELLVKENKNSQALLKQSQARVKELEEQKIGLQNQNDELQHQNVDLQSQNKRLQYQNEELLKQVADSVPAFQLTAAQLELASAKNEIEQVTGQKQKQIESLIGKAEKLETECNHLKEQNQKVKSDKDQMESNLRMAEDRVCMLQTESAKLNIKMETISCESEAKTKHAQNLMAEKEQTIFSQEKHLKDLEDQLRKERQNIEMLQQNLPRQLSLREDAAINSLRTSSAESFAEVDWHYPEKSGLVYGNPYGSVPETASAVRKTKECPYCEREFEEDMCDTHIQLEHVLACQYCSATYSVLDKQVYDDHVFCHTVEDDF